MTLIPIVLCFILFYSFGNTTEHGVATEENKLHQLVPPPTKSSSYKRRKD